MQARSTCRRPWERVRRKNPCPHRILALAKEKAEKKKNRGGDITPMRHRRSLFFVAPATSAGTPSRRKPGETVKALPGRPGRGGCGLPSAPKLPQAAAPEARSSCRTKLHTMRGRCGRTSFGPGASMARLGRESCVGMAVRLAVGVKGSHNQKPPPATAAPAAHQSHASLLTSAQNCPELPGIARLRGGPEQVSAHRGGDIRRSRSASRRAP